MEKSINFLIRAIFLLSIALFMLVLIFVPKEEIIQEDIYNEYVESENIENIPIDNSYLDEREMKLNEVLIDNMDELFSVYTGELSRGNVSEYIRNVLLIEIYDLKEKIVNIEYYEEHKEEIIKIYGIKEYDEFVEFYEYIQDYEEKVYSITVEKDSVNMMDDKTIFNIKVLFDSGNEKIFKVLIRNNVSSNNIESPNIIINTK